MWTLATSSRTSNYYKEEHFNNTQYYLEITLVYKEGWSKRCKNYFNPFGNLFVQIVHCIPINIYLFSLLCHGQNGKRHNFLLPSIMSNNLYVCWHIPSKFYLSWCQMNQTCEMFSFRSWQIFLLLESPLELVDLQVSRCKVPMLSGHRNKSLSSIPATTTYADADNLWHNVYSYVICTEWHNTNTN